LQNLEKGQNQAVYVWEEFTTLSGAGRGQVHAFGLPFLSGMRFPAENGTVPAKVAFRSAKVRAFRGAKGDFPHY
jgi:hypothetical protein